MGAIVGANKVSTAPFCLCVFSQERNSHLHDTAHAKQFTGPSRDLLTLTYREDYQKILSDLSLKEPA